jgi:glycosyltransferase involved in cell wall biosynthesis
MRIAIYHPNLNLFGGGETVALTIAEALSKDNSVDIFTPYDIDKKKLESFFGKDLSKVNIVNFGSFIENLPILNSAKSSMLLRSIYSTLEKYDVVFDTCSNGMFDKKLKTKTICYIHFPNFPKKKKGLKSLMNSLLIFPENAFQYDKIFCNSNFTKSQVEKLTKKPLEVLYPPVDIDKITSSKKKLNRIVSVGRFTEDKKHEVMIDAFKELYKDVKTYDLHLIGSFQENTELYKKSYFDMLKERARGYPIFFHVNMPHDEVLRFLEESKIYWHARGYGETDTLAYENFGITTVEAMAAGCVPIVINLGAQPEIIKELEIGYIWNTILQLVTITKKELSSKKTWKKLYINSTSFKFSERMITCLKK